LLNAVKSEGITNVVTNKALLFSKRLFDLTDGLRFDKTTISTSLP